MAKTIELTKSQAAIVDDNDFERLSAHKWKAHEQTSKKGLFYATRSVWVSEERRYRFEQMHRVVLGVTPDERVDHINGNTLDNRRENLRIASIKQNNYNTKKRIDNKTGYKGVIKKGRGYQAMIMKDGKQTHLGSFDFAEEASSAYKRAAKELFGEFSRP